jgi:hypothetical protein
MFMNSCAAQGPAYYATEAASFQTVLIGVVRVKSGTSYIGGGANIADA